MSVCVRRRVNFLIIPAAAILCVLTVFDYGPTLLKNLGMLEQYGDTNIKDEKQKEKSGDIKREIYTGHPLFITDDITEFVINAKPCQIATPKPLNNQRETEGDSMNLGNRQAKQSSKLEYYDALFLVCSNVKQDRIRAYFRDIYGNVSTTRPYRIKLVFLVGKPTKEATKRSIGVESRTYGDIVMGNFVEHYDNLTYKTAMGWRWASTYCNKMELVLKLDDDVFVDVFKFMQVFQPLVKTQTRTINGWINKHTSVLRKGKYRVSKEEYNPNSYPDFCSGFFIVPSPDIRNSIYPTVKNIRFFRLEDVFTYGMARDAMPSVQLVNIDLVTTETDVYMKCLKMFNNNCKYIGAQIDQVNDLLSLHSQVKFFRDNDRVAHHRFDNVYK